MSITLMSMVTRTRITRGRPNPVAAVIPYGHEVIVTEPIAVMRELAVSGRDRDQAWLDAFIAHAHRLLPGEFAAADVHPISCCFPIAADRYHMHVTLR